MFLQKRGFCTFRQNKTKKAERRIKNANCKAKYVQKIYYICMYVSICLGYLTKIEDALLYLPYHISLPYLPHTEMCGVFWEGHSFFVVCFKCCNLENQ